MIERNRRVRGPCYATDSASQVTANYMENESGNNGDRAPARGSFLKPVALTLGAAALVIVLFVLPAEYGVDPTGVGEKLGLMDLAEAEAPGAVTADALETATVVAGEFPPINENFDYYEPDVMGDPFSRTHDEPFRSDEMTVRLEEFEQVEVKATMHQGDALVYRWTLTEGTVVYSDFHADPGDRPGYPEGYWVRYLEREGDSASGSIVAPFDGNHGWYWLNIEENPVEIRLEVHGYYDSLDEVMRSFQ